MTEGLVPENQYTSTLYGLIKDEEYHEAIRILEYELQNFPRSRAALSLLGYCYYHTSRFPEAATTYERLCHLYPDTDSTEEYRIYHAQSLFHAGAYPEAHRSMTKIRWSPPYAHRASLLKATIAYERDDLPMSRRILDESHCLSDDPEMIVAYAAISFKEGNYDDALAGYEDALNTLGFEADVAYGVALCRYVLEDYIGANTMLDKIIEEGVRRHPELSPSGARSVGDNSSTLRDSYLVEAYNLKAAISYDMKQIDEAQSHLNDMPPRNEEELDPVTLHNQALMHMNDDATSGFRKLNFLLSNPPFPRETFGNLLLLYCQYGYHDLAADILAENSHLTYNFLSQDLYDYLDASIMVTTSPEEAHRKFEALATAHISKLRKYTKALSDANASKIKNDIETALKNLEEELERYIPVLMAQAKIHWDRHDYETVERLFRQSAEFCADHEAWKINVAHVLYMQQGSKFKDAIRYYKPMVEGILAKKRDNDDMVGTRITLWEAEAKEETETPPPSSSSILDVPAIVLANLCVAYIMTNRNEEAEDIMRQIEKDEEKLESSIPSTDNPPTCKKNVNVGQRTFHSCIVNLVIGTLYCEKGNFEFGISRICKSLEPIKKKLGPDTWFYTKRCFLALAETMAKGMLTLKDVTARDILEFLDQVERHGREISLTVHSGPQSLEQQGDEVVEGGAGAVGRETNKKYKSVSQEARHLKRLFVKLID